MHHLFHNRDMNQTLKRYDVVVLGAGAAGLMCALTAAKRGKSVVVLDKSAKIGEKIRISGGGRCNFTNLHASAESFISNNPHFCKSALAGYSQWDFIDWVQETAITYHEREHGQLFCDGSATQIITMLVQACEKYAVQFDLSVDIQDVSKEDDFLLQTSAGAYQAASLVVATGGLSIPKIGATAFGLQLAEQFGLKVLPPRAGLVPFTFTGKEKDAFTALAGISLAVSVSCRGKSFREAMLFTHRGLSGPAMLQISSYWQPGDSLCVNLLPDLDIAAWLENKSLERPKAQLATVLSEVLPKRLVKELMKQLPANLPLQQLNKEQVQQTVLLLNKWMLKPNGTEGYRTAEVTLGGVDTDGLSSQTMESKAVPNLYFIGEVVDVTGHLGGFNFQWAWSSGYAAGMAVDGI